MCQVLAASTQGMTGTACKSTCFGNGWLTGEGASCTMASASSWASPVGSAAAAPAGTCAPRQREINHVMLRCMHACVHADRVMYLDINMHCHSTASHRHQQSPLPAPLQSVTACCVHETHLMNVSTDQASVYPFPGAGLGSRHRRCIADVLELGQVGAVERRRLHMWRRVPL